MHVDDTTLPLLEKDRTAMRTARLWGYLGAQVALRAGSANRGLPNTRVATRDANRRVKKRTPKHDSLLNRPGTTVRLPLSIARIAACATNSALFVDAFAIHE